MFKALTIIMLLAIPVSTATCQVQIDDDVRDSYRKFLESDDFQRQLARLESVSRIESFLTSPNYSDIVQSLVQNPEMLPAFGLSGDQKEQVVKLFRELGVTNDALTKSKSTSEREGLILSRKGIAKQLSEILVQFQIDDLMELPLRKGDLVGLLQNSEVLKSHLKLSEEQREELKVKSHKIGLEILEFVVKKRHEAANEVASVLTDEQNAALVKIYGPDVLNAAFGRVQFEQLAASMLRGIDEGKITRLRETNPAYSEIDVWKSVKD